jgi:hypothetical protein
MPSNNPNVCVPCRYVARQTSRCPHCGAEMVYKRYTWRAPRKTNDAAWKRIEAGHWNWDETVSRTNREQRRGPFHERFPRRWPTLGLKKRRGGRIRPDYLA